jgi:uncharacterized protein (UPF0332 family)
MSSAKTYKSKYQGEPGLYKASKKTSGQIYKGKDKDKKREKGVIFKLERLYDKATEVASKTGETITEAFERLKKEFGFNQGGMPRKRIGSIDYRKGGMVVNTTDNRKNK